MGTGRHISDVQRRCSMKSPYRHPDGGQDRGQRYAISYWDGLGTARDFGFADDDEQAQKMLLRAQTRWRNAYIRKRLT